MALWQFMTFTVLLGALLVYASVITRRLGRADARLNRIEDAVLTNRHSVESAGVQAAGVKAEVSARKEDRGAYLTIRDLRARSEQLNSQSTRSNNLKYVAATERRGAPPRRNEPLNLPSMHAVSRDSPVSPPPPEEAMREDPVAASLESREAVPTNSEQPSLSTLEVVSGDSSEPPNPPPTPATSGDSDDLVAKKKRDTLLFLNNQRRRRRVHLGY